MLNNHKITNFFVKSKKLVGMSGRGPVYCFFVPLTPCQFDLAVRVALNLPWNYTVNFKNHSILIYYVRFYIENIWGKQVGKGHQDDPASGRADQSAFRVLSIPDQ